MKRALPWIISAVLCVAWCIVVWQVPSSWLGDWGRRPGEPNQIDTLTRPRFKPVEIPPAEVARPATVIIYEAPDTALRKAIVKGPVIAQVELNRRLMTITTIDSLGNVQGATYSLKDLRRGVVSFDGTTRLERRAKRRRAIKRIAIATAAVATVITTLILTK